MLIDEYQIKPGEKLPPERELVEKWGISRNVLREAFHVLERRGVIVSSQGRGRFLRELPNQDSKENKYEVLSKKLERCSLLEAFELRQMLEAKVMELVVKNASDADIEEIEKKFQTMKEKFIQLNLTVGELDLHRLYAAKSGNLFLEQILEIVFTAILELMRNDFIEVFSAHHPQATIAAHERIIQALKNRDTQEAQKQMHMHLQETVNML
jgi:GntR family transcriptional repressor for pyruvate dehydrogenase complex